MQNSIGLSANIATYPNKRGKWSHFCIVENIALSKSKLTKQNIIQTHISFYNKTIFRYS